MVVKKINRNNSSVTPFLKWAGGKRQLVNEITKYVPKKYKTYYEPFVGGGAILFALKPKKAIINDINFELMNVYEVVRDDVDLLVKDLKKHKNDKEYYYKIRELDRKKEYNSLPDYIKASRIIYLNKTCYNGLFRVNKKGYFNVPFGKYKNPDIINEEVLRAVSKYLNESKIKILNTDFVDALNGITKDDFVYLDPPYDPISVSASFTSYNLNGFDKNEQKRLKKICDKLHEKGCKFLLSNSATPFIKKLYKEKDYYIEIVQANRSINSNPSLRGKIDEVLVRNYVI